MDFIAIQNTKHSYIKPLPNNLGNGVNVFNFEQILNYLQPLLVKDYHGRIKELDSYRRLMIKQADINPKWYERFYPKVNVFNNSILTELCDVYVDLGLDALKEQIEMISGLDKYLLPSFIILLHDSEKENLTNYMFVCNLLEIDYIVLSQKYDTYESDLKKLLNYKRKFKLW